MDARYFADISNYTDRFQALHYASAGPIVVELLATDGESFVSDKYAEQATHAHQAGLTVVHYHFCRPEQDPTATGEASHFWRTIAPHWHPGDRLMLDIERQHPNGRDGLNRYVHLLDTKLHTISGQAALGYMPDAMFREQGAGLQVISCEWIIASWGGRVARLGAGRRMWAQQISNGEEGYQPMRMPGIGACDTNRLQRWALRRLRRERAARAKARK